MTSLSRLTEVQQFQVIFYNDQPLSRYSTQWPVPHVFWETDAQRLEISELVGAIAPDGGTEHLPALELALKFEPDVIFLLTDGASKALNSAELNKSPHSTVEALIFIASSSAPRLRHQETRL